MKLTKIALLAIAGTALLFLPRRSSKDNAHLHIQDRSSADDAISSESADPVSADRGDNSSDNRGNGDGSGDSKSADKA